MAAQVDIEQRVSDIADWIMSEMPYSEILSKSVGEFKVSKRQAERYISDANAIVREARLRQKEAMITRAIGKLERIHDKAIAREDCSAATGAVRELVKLLGLAEPDKQEVTHDVTDRALSLAARIRNGEEVHIEVE
jgi:hypothetical protein